MQPDTKKRFHSALQEPYLAQESKRAKGAMEGHKSMKPIQREIFHLEKNCNKLHFSYKTTDSNQTETPERRNTFSRPESLDWRGSQICIGDVENPTFMPNIPFSHAILVASGCKASPNDHYKLKLGSSDGNPRDLSSCSDDSSSEINNSASNSDRALSYPRAPANNAASSSSPRTVSDYRSDSDSEPESGDGLASSHSISPPSAFRCTTGPVPGSSTLKSRLTSFIPAIQAANETLERELTEGRLGSRNIEDVDEDDEQYIEMNLGLGVLEEKPPRDISWGPHEDESESEISSGSEPQTEIDLTSESDSESGSESEDGRTIEKDVLHMNRENNLLRTKPHPRASIQKDQETNYLARLMGQRRRPDQLPKKSTIEVLP